MFGVAFSFNFGLDSMRHDVLQPSIRSQEMSLSSYLLEEEFAQHFGGDRCDIIGERINQLAGETVEIGNDLSKYSAGTLFLQEDFDYLKRRYFLSEIQLFIILEEYNDVCGHAITPVLFFYDVDGETSVKQRYILDNFVDGSDGEVTLFSFDVEYTDEPTLNILKQQYSITRAPSVVIGNQTRSGVVYFGELRAMMVEGNESLKL